MGAQAWRPCPPHPPSTQPEGAWGGDRESRPSSWLPSLGFFFFPKVWAFLKDFFLSISCAAPDFQENG